MRARILRRLAPTFIAVALAAPFLVEAGFSRKIVNNTINPIAGLRDGGRRVTLTGPISCSQIERVDLRVTVTQRTTGAIAEGRARLVGTTQVQHWEVEAVVRGDEFFDTGPATAVAYAISSRAGAPTDSHQWLVPVTLEME